MTTTRCADVVSVPDMVERGLNRIAVERRRVGRAPFAVRTARLAVLYRREARWWGVLIDWVYSPRSGSTSRAFGRAAFMAQAHAERVADEYAEHAASIRRRAALDGVGVVA